MQWSKKYNIALWNKVELKNEVAWNDPNRTQVKYFKFYFSCMGVNVLSFFPPLEA